MDESRLWVIVRLPAVPERMVRETRAGAVEGASALETSAPVGAFLTTDHFSLPAEIGVFAKDCDATV